MLDCERTVFISSLMSNISLRESEKSSKTAARGNLLLIGLNHTVNWSFAYSTVKTDWWGYLAPVLLCTGSELLVAIGSFLTLKESMLHYVIFWILAKKTCFQLVNCILAFQEFENHLSLMLHFGWWC